MKSFLTGVATGLAIGYLTAPRSGKDTRQQLAGAANKKTDEMKGQWDRNTSQVNKLVDDIKSQTGLFGQELNAYADKAEDKFDAYKADAKRAGYEVKDQYNSKVDETADAAKEDIDKAENALK